MQKNLVLAIVLSSAVYILWYSFIEKKPAFNQVSAPAATAQVNTPQAAAGTASSGFGAAAAAAPASPLEPGWASRAVELKLNKATYSFHPAGASLKSVIYQGPRGPGRTCKGPRPRLPQLF